MRARKQWKEIHRLLLPPNALPNRMVFSHLLRMPKIPTSGNRRHQVETTPKPPARFTAISGGNVHPTDPNISEMNPLVQLETNERDALPDEQGSQRAPKEKSVGQERDHQNVSQNEGSQSKLSSSAVFAIVHRLFEASQSMCRLTFSSPFSSPSSFIWPCLPDCSYSHLQVEKDALASQHLRTHRQVHTT